MNFKKIMLTVLMLILTINLIGCSSKASNETTDGEGVITLKVSSAWAEGNSLLFNIDDFVQKVDEKTNGTVKVVWGGGPETIPAYQMVEALRNGIIDIAWTSHTYNVSYIPVMEAMKLTDATTMRESGGFDFVNELYYDKFSIHYIAATTDGLTYNLYTKKATRTLEDFNGMTIRATPAYQAFVESLGAGVVNTSPGEAYQALERNVIQGYGWPSVGVTDFGWQEVSQYIIQPAFYNVDVAVLMSDKAWNKLNEDQRAAIMEAGAEIEAESKAYYEVAIVEENNVLLDAGMEEIVLPDDVAKIYYNLAYEKGWESAINVDVENAEKLQEFAGYKK